jgi:two-component system NtrC family sensor kinase
MSEDEQRKVLRPFLAKFSALLVLWLLSSWYVADLTLKSQTRKLIQDESTSLEELTGKTAETIHLGLDYLHGIPELVAKDELLQPAMAKFGSIKPSSLPLEQRKNIWSANPELKALDNYLYDVHGSLKADVVWITNAAGDCIASSNSQTPESFVGTNYADRDYFIRARHGKPGRQYAMGRVTNIPGLFFSTPIFHKGHFAGAAVAKVDLPKLRNWVTQGNTFVSDEHGIIILAHNPALEMLSLPDADIAQIPEAERLSRYKRTDFPPLAISPWDENRFPALRRLADETQPVLISSRHITDEALEIRTFKRLPSVAGFDQERLKVFMLTGASGGLLLSIVAAVIFIARLRRNSALRAAESASLLRAAINSTADGILVVDNERRITAYNQRFLDIWHIPAEIVAGGNDIEALKCATERVVDPLAFMEKVQELYKHPELNSYEIFRLKDGTEVERYSSPQRLRERIVGRVWGYRDITEQRRTEQALLNSRNDLENKVRERTTDLQSVNSALRAEKARQEELIKQLAEAQNQLLQSEKMASIGQLAAGVAHEINNPVGYVNSNLATLQQYVADMLKILSAYEKGEAEMTDATRTAVADLKQKADVDYIRKDIEKLISESIGGLQRVKRIVLDLKDFSHVGEATRQWANIEKGMDSTLNIVWNELKYKAEVIKEYGGISDIECIPTQINQVFMNLLMNAAQAIEVHGRITIRTGQEAENIWVEVEDTGSGIEKKNLTRIFDPFFTTKPVGQGTGLGLSLSYGIVQKHGGRIEVRSERGKGTTFRVVLPRQMADSSKAVAVSS